MDVPYANGCPQGRSTGIHIREAELLRVYFCGTLHASDQLLDYVWKFVSIKVKASAEDFKWRFSTRSQLCSSLHGEQYDIEKAYCNHKCSWYIIIEVSLYFISIGKKKTLRILFEHRKKSTVQCAQHRSSRLYHQGLVTPLALSCNLIMNASVMMMLS